MALMSRATHVLQWPAQRDAKQQCGANPYKTGPSSDCGLKLVHMKVESLVIANQKVAVNTFPGLVHTARHTTKARCNRSGPAGSDPPVWSPKATHTFSESRRPHRPSSKGKNGEETEGQTQWGPEVVAGDWGEVVTR